MDAAIFVVGYDLARELFVARCKNGSIVSAEAGAL